MSDEINAQFGFERVFGKTNGNADADTKITKFGISFNSDGTTTFFAQLEKSSASQKAVSYTHLPSNVRLEFASILSQSISPNFHLSVICWTDSLNAALVSLH